MDREDAQLYIDESIGVYEPTDFDCSKSRLALGVNSFVSLRQTVEVKPRLCFITPPSLQANEYKLPQSEEKPPLPVFARPPEYDFLPQEKKFIARGDFVVPIGEIDTNPILQMRSPEKYIEAVCSNFKGTNIVGKLAVTLNKRLARMKTREQVEQIAEERKQAREQRRKEQYERARAERRVTVFSAAANLCAYFSVLLAVVAVLLGWASRPLIVSDSTGIFYYGLTFSAFAMFVVSCILNIVGRCKYSNLFNEHTLIICGVCSLAAALYYPIYKLNKYAVIAIFAAVAFAVVFVIVYKIKKSKDRITLRAALINLAVIAFTVIVCVQLSVKTFDERDYDGHSGEFYYNELSDGTLQVTVKKFSENMTVPEVINGKTVTSIRMNPASGFSNKLERITLPETITDVDSLFTDCKNLVEVSAPSLIVSRLPLTKIQRLHITGGEVLNDGMLRLATALNYVEVNGVTRIASNVFSRCYNLTEAYIGDGVESIGNAAFGMCRSLISVRLPDSVKELGGYLFTNCTDLRNIYLPDSITEIPIGLFNGCEALEQVTVPSGVTKINGMAFAGCVQLHSLVIPDSVTDLRGDRIFENCNNIISLSAPAEVINQIPHENLVSIYITGNVIPQRAFFACRSLQYLTISNSVTEIQERAFQGCSSLTDVNMSSSVTEIGRYAFAGCRKLESFSFPAGITKIGGWMFEWCTALKHVYMPGTVTEIEDAAFWGCEALAEIDIPYAVETIGAGAFAHCKSLTEVGLPAQLTEISTHTFAYCTNLKNVIIPHSVKRINEEAFLECGLQSVYYVGMQEDWNNITILSSGNEPLSAAEKLFSGTIVASA